MWHFIGSQLSKADGKYSIIETDDIESPSMDYSSDYSDVRAGTKGRRGKFTFWIFNLLLTPIHQSYIFRRKVLYKRTKFRKMPLL